MSGKKGLSKPKMMQPKEYAHSKPWKEFSPFFVGVYLLRAVVLYKRTKTSIINQLLLKRYIPLWGIFHTITNFSSQ
jgi:hypothetical protein